MDISQTRNKSGRTRTMEPTSKAGSGTPTSTTKALLLFIHVPKVHRIYVQQDEEEDEEQDSRTASQSLGSVKTSLASLRNEKALLPDDSFRTNEEEVKDKKVSISVPTKEDAKDDDSEEGTIGYVEADDEVEHVITAEEMATVVKLDEKLKEKEGEEEETESKAASADNEAEKQEETRTLTGTMMKVFFGVITNNEDETKTELNREEAIRAIKEQRSQMDDLTETEASPEKRQGPAPNTEIRLQALLHLTFKNMDKEGCFYTAPTVTSIAKGEEQDEWIQFTIMVKPSSIGLVLEGLERIGVGSSVGMISIYKTELLRTADWPGLQQKKEEDNKSIRVTGKKKKEKDGVNLEAARSEWKNAASRLRVEQVQEQIQEQAAMSLDFLALLIIASILAGIGLITNSTVVIVASMLVSPIMGPVMGMTFGTRVLDWKLARESALVEVSALAIAVVIGAIVGFGSSWSLGDNWPNDEMGSRGDIAGLITGIAIAIPSGMGVALSILGNNTASLVGVAISASLLPPAVNAGICWAHAILIQFDDTMENTEDFVSIGAISFALTCVNIVCIWVSGILMFTIKEVAPSEKKSAFWSRDIKTARAIRKNGVKDPEVDLDTLKAGLQDALERKKAEENGEGPRARFRRRLRRRRKQQFSFNLADDPIDDEDYLYYMLGLSPVEESTKPADERQDLMARYLGFRTSLQDFEVEEDLAAQDSIAGWKSLFL